MIKKNVFYILGVIASVLFTAEPVFAGSAEYEARLRKIIIPNFVIYEDLHTFSEVTTELGKQAKENDPAGINLIGRAGGGNAEIASYSAPKTSVYDILSDLQGRGDLDFRICENMVLVAPAKVKLKNIPPVKTVGDCRNMLKKMDETLFPAVDFVQIEMGAVLHFLRNRNTEIQISVIQSENSKEKFLTLELRNVTLRQLLDCICLLTGSRYEVMPGRIRFFY